MLDLSTLIGLSPDDAVVVATDAGFQDVRVLEFVDDELIGAMDMSLRPNRLNLEIENWRVRRAVFGSDPVTCRISGGFRLGLTGALWPPSGAVSGRSTLLSGLFRRRTPVSEDLCL